MPTYDYACDACGHRFELFQSMTAPVKRKCPDCGKPRLKRLVGTGAGVIFKGGGFYETDYRSDSYKKAAEAEQKTAAGTAKPADEGKKKPDEAKPAAEAAPTKTPAKTPVEAKKSAPSAGKRAKRGR